MLASTPRSGGLDDFKCVTKPTGSVIGSLPPTWNCDIVDICREEDLCPVFVFPRQAFSAHTRLASSALVMGLIMWLVFLNDSLSAGTKFMLIYLVVENLWEWKLCYTY